MSRSHLLLAFCAFLPLSSAHATSPVKDDATTPVQLAASTRTQAHGAKPATTSQALPSTEAAPAAIPARPECGWTGERIVGLLWRDDINTAREHTNFYDRFGCPKEQLTTAFRCVIELNEKLQKQPQPQPQQGQPQAQPQQPDINVQIHACWQAPENPVLPQPPAPAAQQPAPEGEKPQQQDGSQPKQ